MPLKIKNFFLLKTEEFLSIIKKISKNKISLIKLDEWEEYFNGKNILFPIRTRSMK